MNLPAIRRRHLPAYLAATCVLAVACLNAVPGNSLDAMTLQTTLAAACIVATLALFDPVALRGGHRTSANLRRALATCACLLGIALAAGLATAVSYLLSAAGETRVAAVQAQPGPAGIALFLALCLVTGVFEESLFRGVLFRGFAEALAAAGRRCPLAVAAASSAAVFGILHVSGFGASTPPDAVSIAQFVGKPVQAALFGFIVAGAYARSGNLWLVAGAHAAFNALSELPAFASSGLVAQTYVTGNPVDLAVMLGTVVLFVPLALGAARFFNEADRAPAPSRTCIL